MVRERSRIGLVPVLGGLALALTVLATMIGGVGAQPPPSGNTVCNRCWNNAWARADTDEICPYSLDQARHGCIYNYAYTKCYVEGSPPACPSTDEAPTTVTCAGMLGSGACENGAQGICTNATWNVNCEANTSKKCQDTQVPPMGTATPCHVSCICRE